MRMKHFFKLYFSNFNVYFTYNSNYKIFFEKNIINKVLKKDARRELNPDFPHDKFSLRQNMCIYILSPCCPVH